MQTQKDASSFQKQVSRYPESFLTRFLTLAEQKLVQQARPDAKFDGGYPNAELVRAYTTSDSAIVGLKISVDDSLGEIGHRHVMGSLLALGIERDTFGDILIMEDFVVFVTADIAKFIETNLQVSGRPTSIRRLEEAITYTQTLQEKTVISTSMRVDNLVASVYNMSRSNAQALIKRGYVRINGVEMESQTKELVVGDILSVRTKGKAKVVAQSGKSKKDKWILTIGYYVD
jgi:RNA-binding protein YlmH